MIRGERFEVDLGSDDDEERAPPLPASFVNDVLERQPSTATAPKAPTLKNKTGFPEHKKRTVQSRFKQKHATEAVSSAAAPASEEQTPAKAKSWVEEEKQRIDEENRHRLAEMSPEQLEEERQELLSSLSPTMIERLLKRSNIESGSNEGDVSSPSQQTIPNPEPSKKKPTKTVSFAEPAAENPEQRVDDTTDVVPEMPDVELLPHDSVHFPRPSQPPSLDPSSATFLADLHDKYFPSLPAEPDKLEWMQASIGADNKAYSPSAAAFNAKDIRFSFTGELIAPKTAALIPVTEGLHHHGDAPDAAGYTVAELAHLSRSTYAAQRCIAFQTLGRFLYRLGKGEFGNPGEPGADVTGNEDSLGELARGLWHEVEAGKVIETLVLESEGKGVGGGKHVSAKAYATEAVHLWRKGGGRRWKAS
ncbi:hypothetical protein LTR10_003460 [Elasticomyces elasticus]|nr:hypothetical protein LTR10_003460 [Elasticomyces elasticus]KAK4969728.1 hypothetical protein LTR42_009000 [Elasticomyces elasticus]